MMVLWLTLGSAQALTLEEARERAEEHAVEVQLSEAAADASRAYAWELIGAALPSVVGSFDFSTGSGLTSFGFQRPVSNQFGLGVSASWRLIDPSLWFAAASARRTADGQQAMLDWSRLIARSQATAAYARALGAEEKVAAWERSLEDAERQAAAARSLVASGLRPAADAAQAEAARLGASAGVIASVGERIALCAELQGLLLLPVTGECELVPTEFLDPGEPAAEHPALVASREALSAAETARSAAIAGFAPTVDVFGTAAQYWVDDSKGMGWNAGVGVDLPLFQGTSQMARVRAASADTRGAQASLAGQERDLDVLRISAEARLAAARASVEALRESLVSAEEALRLVDERYTAGLQGITDWLQARRQRDLALIALADGRAALGVAVAELEAAVGSAD